MKESWTNRGCPSFSPTQAAQTEAGVSRGQGMRKSTGHTGSFNAIDDTGTQHTLYLFTTFADASDRSGREEIEVSRSVRTVTGDLVNRLGKGLYQVAATGANLRSNDPNAP
jgi:hypothetical protein